MSDSLDNLPPGQPIDDLVALAPAQPELMGAIQAEVGKHVLDAESLFPQPKSGAAKKQYVSTKTAAILIQLADAVVDVAASIIPGFPVPLANFIKAVAVPALPDLIDEVVEALKQSGLL